MKIENSKEYTLWHHILSYYEVEQQIKAFYIDEIFVENIYFSTLSIVYKLWLFINKYRHMQTHTHVVISI